MNFSNCPIPNWRGSSQPEGLCTNGVLILAEALGAHEAEDGLPMRPHAPAGSVLERAIRRSGFDRQQFGLWNVVPVQPPNNWLEGAPYEAAAVAWGLTFLPEVLAQFKPRVILALGNVALRATTTLGDISITRGYPLPSRYDIPVIGSLHPAYLRRGAMSHLGVLMHDLKFAVALAARRIYTQPVEFWSPILWRQVSYDIPFPLPPLNAIRPEPLYKGYPSEQEAIDFLKCCEACELHPNTTIAYDIETPYGATKEEDEDDDSDKILSIQFSLAPKTGIFFPWRSGFIDVARRILALRSPKAGANCWRFDAPRLAAHSITIAGPHHDLRWAWKYLQPDLSASLQFITSFYSPEMLPWKHLASVNPPIYGIRDVDACQRIIQDREAR